MATINMVVDLSFDTITALTRYCEQWGYDWWGPEVEANNFAWLIALLGAEEDTRHLFPKGKWATLQHLQGVLAKAIEMERQVREVCMAGCTCPCHKQFRRTLTSLDDDNKEQN